VGDDHPQARQLQVGAFLFCFSALRDRCFVIDGVDVGLEIRSVQAGGSVAPFQFCGVCLEAESRAMGGSVVPAVVVDVEAEPVEAGGRGVAEVGQLEDVLY